MEIICLNHPVTLVVILSNICQTHAYNSVKLSQIAFRYKMAPIAIRKIAYDLERLNAKALLENSKQPLPIKIPKIKQCDQIM